MRKKDSINIRYNSLQNLFLKVETMHSIPACDLTISLGSEHIEITDGTNSLVLDVDLTDDFEDVLLVNGDRCLVFQTREDADEPLDFGIDYLKKTDRGYEFGIESNYSSIGICTDFDLSITDIYSDVEYDCILDDFAELYRDAKSLFDGKEIFFTGRYTTYQNFLNNTLSPVVLDPTDMVAEVFLPEDIESLTNNGVLIANISNLSYLHLDNGRVYYEKECKMLNLSKPLYEGDNTSWFRYNFSTDEYRTWVGIDEVGIMICHDLIIEFEGITILDSQICGLKVYEDMYMLFIDVTCMCVGNRSEPELRLVVFLDRGTLDLRYFLYKSDEELDVTVSDEALAVYNKARLLL